MEDKCAYTTYKELVIMAPENGSIMRGILAEAIKVGTHDMKSYVVEHQKIHSRLMKADPMENAEASTYAAHMNRLLDGLASKQKLAMNYLFYTWKDRSKASAKNVYKVGLKLVKYLSNEGKILAATANPRKNQSKQKSSNDKCPKHPFLFHKWAKRDLNLNTRDPISRDKRKALKLARAANGESGYKQGQGSKSSKDDEIPNLKAQLASATQTGTVDTEPTAETPMDLFAALCSTLETIAANEVNGPVSENLYTISPRNIINSGTSMPFVKEISAITNPKKHVQSLITAEGHTTKSTHPGKLQITEGNQPISLSALVVSSFKDNLISARQMTKTHNIVFTNEDVYIQGKCNLNSSVRRIGGRGLDTLHTILKEKVIGTSSLHAMSAMLTVPSNLPLHETLNHANPKTIQDLKQLYPNSAAFILNKLQDEKKKNGPSCTPCVIGKA